MKLQSNIKHFWAAAFLLFLLDLGTKIWALNYLALEDEYLINQLISFQRVFNESTFLLDYHLPFITSTFGFRIVYVIVATIITLSIYWVIKQPVLSEKNIETEFAKTGLFFIIGSTWGNTFDRVFRSEGVIDFIRINYFTESIPIMNVADITLHIGNLCFFITWSIIIYKHILKHHNKMISK